MVKNANGSIPVSVAFAEWQKDPEYVKERDALKEEFAEERRRIKAKKAREAARLKRAPAKPAKPHPPQWVASK